MELDDLKTLWTRHEQALVEQTRLNKELIMKLLVLDAARRVEWIKIRMVTVLILSYAGIIFIAAPRIEFVLKFGVIAGIVVAFSIALLTTVWYIKGYLYLEKVNFREPMLQVRKRLKQAEKYKLKTRRNGLILAPLMVAGIFLSTGVDILSVKMVPFYTLSALVFLVSTFVNNRYGLAARIRKIDSDLEEIAGLESGRDHQSSIFPP